MMPAGTTMPEWLRQRALSTPDRMAVLWQGKSISFAELDRFVDAASQKLTQTGVGTSTRVALLGANSLDYVVAVNAAARVGAVLLPLNIRLTVNELAWQLDDAGPAVLLHDAGQTEVATELASRRSGLRLLPLADLAKATTPTSTAPPRSIDLDDVFTVMYTAGTTGMPKGAQLTYGNHAWSAIGSAFNLGVLPEDRWLVCLPLFHVGGLSTLFKSVLYGMPCVLHQGFEPAAVNRAIDENGVTIVSVVAAMLQRMLQERGGKPYPASLRCVLLGGGPAPRPLLEQCASLGVPVVQTYGLTEAASQVATLAPEDALRKLGSAGKPLMPLELAIVRPDGSALLAGEAGEIVVRGPVVTPGYLNRPEETARVLADGWLHTGDVGYLDGNGYLYVLDRRDDLIVSGGENVYPAEVESVLQSHPHVFEAAVFAVADERWGQTPAAAIVVRDEVTLKEEDVLAHCRERLAAYKVPSRIYFVDELPHGASGKLLRYAVREQLAPPS